MDLDIQPLETKEKLLEWTDEQIAEYVEKCPKKDMEHPESRATERDRICWETLRALGFSHDRMSKVTGWSVSSIRVYFSNKKRQTALLEKQQSKKEEVKVIEDEPAKETVEVVRIIKEEPEEVIDDDSELTMTDRALKKKLTEIMEQSGVGEKIRQYVIPAIMDAPHYQTYDGMLRLLQNSNGVGTQKAQVIVERFFGYDMKKKMMDAMQIQAFGTHSPYGGYNPFNQQNQGAPNPYGYPPQQQSGQPQYYPPPYYPPQQQQSMSPEQIKLEIENAKREASEEIRKQYEEERKERETKEQIEALRIQIKQSQERVDSNTIVERVLIMDDSGNPVKDPETGEFLYNTIQHPIQKEDPMMAIVQEMQKSNERTLEAIKSMNAPATSEKEIEMRERLARADLEAKLLTLEQKMESDKKEMMSMSEISNLRKEMADIQERGMSEDAKLVSQSVDKQFGMIEKTMSNMHENATLAFGLIKEVLQGPPTAEQRERRERRANNPPQWADDEVDELAELEDA